MNKLDIFDNKKPKGKKMQENVGLTTFHRYHVQKFPQKDGGSHSKLIVTARHHFNKTL